MSAFTLAPTRIFSLGPSWIRSARRRRAWARARRSRFSMAVLPAAEPEGGSRRVAAYPQAMGTKILGVALLLGLTLAACASDSGDSGGTVGQQTGCVPGDQKACACPGGAQGAQACSADGKGYADCVCGAGGAGGASGAGGGAGAAGKPTIPDCGPTDQKGNDCAKNWYPGAQCARKDKNGNACAMLCSPNDTIWTNGSCVLLRDLRRVRASPRTAVERVLDGHDHAGLHGRRGALAGHDDVDAVG